MPQGLYLPEGMRINTEKNRAYTSGHGGMMKAMAENATVEASAVVCDSRHNLHVDINGMKGIIPRDETALGIKEGKVREIAVISRVGKPVCFKVTDRKNDVYILSRRQAQKEAMDYFWENLGEGEIIKAVVTHLEPFGAFADIGCGNISLMGIENISVSRIEHPGERFYPGQHIFAVVLSKNKKLGRITLSHRELLGTWEENSRMFACGQTAIGTVRGVEDYGIFVELAPNLSGLAERREGIECGDSVSVYIKSMIPEKMKVKLVIIDRLTGSGRGIIKSDDYFISEGRLGKWIYSPEECRTKYIATHFE